MKSLLTLIAILVFAGASFAAEVSKSEVDNFFYQWLTVQNTGSFSRYADMYAADFQGIKRSGNRTSRYKHDKWLEDRKSMFNKKMTVSADNLQIKTLQTGAVVRFEQTWESNGFKDIGFKEMTLIQRKNKLLIAREEMLASKVVAAKGMVFDPANLAFTFAIKEGIVLPNMVVKTLDLKKLKLNIHKILDYSVSIPVEGTLLSPSPQSLLGTRVRLYGPKGACESKINGFMVVSKKSPHFGELQRWRDEKTASLKIAENIYEEGEKHIVATTEKCSGDFAKDARLEESPIFIGMKAGKVTAELARKSFKTLPDYNTEIKPYTKLEYYESIKEFKIVSRGKTASWVAMYVIAGTPYCGQDGGSLGVLWKVVDGKKGKTLKLAKYIAEQLEYATDIENDGFPEFIFRESASRGLPHYLEYIRSEGSKKDGEVFVESNDQDCPC